MSEFNKKKSYKKYIYSPISLFLLVIILAIFLKALWGVYTKQQISLGYLERQKNELNRLMARQKELSQAVDFLKTDKGIESEIRSKFRVVKEGESVAVIIDDNVPDIPKISTTTSSLGFWGSISHWFGF